MLALTLLLGVYLLAGGALTALGLLLLEGVQRGLTGLLLAQVGGLLVVIAVAVVRALWVTRRESRRPPEGLDRLPTSSRFSGMPCATWRRSSGPERPTGSCSRPS